MEDLISRQAAIEALEQIRYALWEIDIPSPTVPEYIEHHRDVQNVMKRIDEIRDKMECLPSAQPDSLSDAYMKAVWTWLLNYQVKAAELQGKYTPYEVLSMVANDWRKEHE